MVEPRLVTGRAAEDAASALLASKGYRIVERNFRRPQGELDIVAMDGATCVFVEVRSRTGAHFGDPLESITPRKQAQIARAARLYIAEANPPTAHFRFDVVGVVFPSDGQAEPTLTHVENAFTIDR